MQMELKEKYLNLVAKPAVSNYTGQWMIIVNDEAALRLECEDVNFEESKAIINTLEQELYNSAKTGNPGIGLAAPQCGIAKNVAIIRINDIYKVNLVNCSIEN